MHRRCISLLFFPLESPTFRQIRGVFLLVQRTVTITPLSALYQEKIPSLFSSSLPPAVLTPSEPLGPLHFFQLFPPPFLAVPARNGSLAPLWGSPLCFREFIALLSFLRPPHGHDKSSLQAPFLSWSFGLSPFLPSPVAPVHAPFFARLSSG